MREIEMQYCILQRDFNTATGETLNIKPSLVAGKFRGKLPFPSESGKILDSGVVAEQLKAYALLFVFFVHRVSRLVQNSQLEVFGTGEIQTDDTPTTHTNVLL
jgi:hypothetical protein